MAASGRLAKDYLGPDGELLVEDSSEDSGGSSGEEGERGRKAARSSDNLKSSGKSETPEAPRQVKSLLAAAEEERK
jgi:hypothetical protein